MKITITKENIFNINRGICVCVNGTLYLTQDTYLAVLSDIEKTCLCCIGEVDDDGNVVETGFDEHVPFADLIGGEIRPKFAVGTRVLFDSTQSYLSIVKHGEAGTIVSVLPDANERDGCRYLVRMDRASHHFEFGDGKTDEHHGMILSDNELMEFDKLFVSVYPDEI